MAPSDHPPLDFRSPSSIEGAGLYHFRIHFLDLISISYHGQDDPFLTLILPMVSDSPLVRLAIEATATAHLQNLGIASTEEPMRLQSKTLKHLSDAISVVHTPNVTTTFQEELASGIMILVYYETTSGLSAETARWHLSAIYTILTTLSLRNHESRRSDFLKRLFAYFDIFVSLSLGLEPLANPRMFDSLVNTDFCPAFGYAITLYPCLHSLASLQAWKHEIQGSDLDFYSQSVHELEQRLQFWQPPLIAQPSKTGISNSGPWTTDDPTTIQQNLTHERLLQTALAFRSAALLVVSEKLLPLLSPTSPQQSSASHTHYTELFDHLLRLNVLALTSPPQTTASSNELSSDSRLTASNIALQSPPTMPSAFTTLASTCAPLNTITWPLYTAALHAKTASDRAVLSSIFERVYQRHRMGVVGAAKRHVEDVWKNDDVHSPSASPLLA